MGNLDQARKGSGQSLTRGSSINSTLAANDTPLATAIVHGQTGGTMELDTACSNYLPNCYALQLGQDKRRLHISMLTRPLLLYAG